MDWPLFFDLFFDIVLGLAVVVILWCQYRTSQRVDQLTRELDAQREWLHAVDDGVRWEITGGGVEAHPEPRTGTVR